MISMIDDRPCEATPAELKEGYRKCWDTECNRSAWFQDWGGWHWCWKHALREIRINETLVGKLFEIKNMKLRNPHRYTKLWFRSEREKIANEKYEK